MKHSVVGGRINDGKYPCPILAAHRPLCLSYGDADYRPEIIVVEPSGMAVEHVDLSGYIRIHEQMVQDDG